MNERGANVEEDSDKDNEDNGNDDKELLISSDSENNMKRMIKIFKNIVLFFRFRITAIGIRIIQPSL